MRVQPERAESAWLSEEPNVSSSLQLTYNHPLTPVDDLANVADDVLVIFMLDQILALDEIAHRFVDHSPERCIFPACVGMFLAFRDFLDHWAIVLDRRCHEHNILTALN